MVDSIENIIEVWLFFSAKKSDNKYGQFNSDTKGLPRDRECGT